MMRTQSFFLKQFAFNKTRKTISLSFDGSFPSCVLIKSEYTGKTLEFRPVQPGHPAFDEDGWDGEQCVYAPVFPEFCPNVKTVTLYHGG